MTMTNIQHCFAPDRHNEDDGRLILDGAPYAMVTLEFEVCSGVWSFIGAVGPYPLGTVHDSWSSE